MVDADRHILPDADKRRHRDTYSRISINGLGELDNCTDSRDILVIEGF